MSYRRNDTSAATTTTATTTPHATRHPAPARQRSYIVSIDTGSFANVEIIVGDYHHRAGTGVWTTTSSSRAADGVKVVTSKKSHVYAYVPTSPSTPTTKRTPFTPLQQPSAAHSHSSSSTSVSDARSKCSTYERGDRTRDYDYIAARQHRLADERLRAHHQRERHREAEARRLAEAEAEAEAEARRAAAIAKEARRRQRLAEQQRHEQQKRQQEQQRALREDRRRLERTRRARAHEIANAWSSYETRWGLLNQSQSQNQRQQPGDASLTFERIPWPVTDSEIIIPPPLDGRRTRTRTRRAAALDELLKPEAIREFLLSPAHSPEVSSKDRIRTALRRWHPDKFARLLGLVVESDRDAVADGVGIVVRCLNEMLERENHA